MRLDTDLIYRRRNELGYSQSQLARGITTQSTISKIESGELIPSVDVLEPIINKLNITYHQVILKKQTVHDYLINILNITDTQPHRAKHLLEKVPYSKVKSPYERRVHDLVQAKIYLAYNQLEEAGFYASRILEARGVSPTDKIYYNAIMIKGMIYMRQDHLRIAEEYILQVYQYIRDTGVGEQIREANYFLSLYTQLIEFALNRKDYQLSQKGINEALLLCRRAQNHPLFLELMLLKYRQTLLIDARNQAEELYQTIYMGATVLKKEKILRRLKDLKENQKRVTL